MSDLLSRIEKIAESEVVRFEREIAGDLALSLDDARKLDILADLIVRVRRAEKPRTADDLDGINDVQKLEDELRKARAE